MHAFITCGRNTDFVYLFSHQVWAHRSDAADLHDDSGPSRPVLPEALLPALASRCSHSWTWSHPYGPVCVPWCRPYSHTWRYTLGYRLVAFSVTCYTCMEMANLPLCGNLCCLGWLVMLAWKWQIFCRMIICAVLGWLVTLAWKWWVRHRVAVCAVPGDLLRLHKNGKSLTGW